MDNERDPCSFFHEAQSMIKGSLYEHYSGKRYKILGVARHSETLEELVAIYEGMYGEEEIWVRPLPMFLESVTINSVMQPRFRRCL